MAEIILITMLSALPIMWSDPQITPTKSTEKISFKDADINQDDSLDFKEWVASGRSKATFARVDIDKDGKVTREELRVSGAKKKR